VPGTFRGRPILVPHNSVKRRERMRTNVQPDLGIKRVFPGIGAAICRISSPTKARVAKASAARSSMRFINRRQIAARLLANAPYQSHGAAALRQGGGAFRLCGLPQAVLTIADFCRAAALEGFSPSHAARSRALWISKDVTTALHAKARFALALISAPRR